MLRLSVKYGVLGFLLDGGRSSNWGDERDTEEKTTGQRGRSFYRKVLSSLVVRRLKSLAY